MNAQRILAALTRAESQHAAAAWLGMAYSALRKRVARHPELQAVNAACVKRGRSIRALRKVKGRVR